MQFLSAKPLIHQFRTSTFKESEVGPYFVLMTLLTTLSYALSYTEPTEPSPWSPFVIPIELTITAFGLWYLRWKNGGHFGDLFLCKFFALGWVVFVRLSLAALAVILPAMSLLLAFSDENACTEDHPVVAIFSILFTLAFYLWLGRLIGKSLPIARE